MRRIAGTPHVSMLRFCELWHWGQPDIPRIITGITT